MAWFITLRSSTKEPYEMRAVIRFLCAQRFREGLRKIAPAERPEQTWRCGKFRGILDLTTEQKKMSWERAVYGPGMSNAVDGIHVRTDRPVRPPNAASVPGPSHPLRRSVSHSGHAARAVPIPMRCEWRQRGSMNHSSEISELMIHAPTPVLSKDAEASSKAKNLRKPNNSGTNHSARIGGNRSRTGGGLLEDCPRRRPRPGNELRSLRRNPYHRLISLDIKLYSLCIPTGCTRVHKPGLRAFDPEIIVLWWMETPLALTDGARFIDQEIFGRVVEIYSL